MENGKHCIFLGSEEAPFMIYEGDSLYGEELPIFPMSPADYIDSCFGFTEANVHRARNGRLSLPNPTNGVFAAPIF